MGECLLGVAEGRLEGPAGCEAEDGMSGYSTVTGMCRKSWDGGASCSSRRMYVELGDCD